MLSSWPCDDPYACSPSTRSRSDFKKPARIDEALTVETRFERVQGARLFIAQTIGAGERHLGVKLLLKCAALASLGAQSGLRTC